ncbi:MAG: hypothetical protein LUG93_16555 [Lachnospiraceae bacterium]|nr:hypothetical protein [Lachnospiraceae bacterium]
MNIVLIGTIGAGKTSTGKAIAAMSDYRFADVDELAQQRVFSRIPEGEFVSPFRIANLIYGEERKVLSDVAEWDGFVIATGALSTSHPDAVRHLRKNGVIIRLLPDVDTVVSRELRSQRAFMVEAGKSIEETLREDYEKYADQYLDFDYSLDVSDDETPEFFASQILEWVNTSWKQGQ